MNRRLVLSIFILIVVSILVIGQTKWGVAAKEERYWFIKIIEKLENVMKNQQEILKEVRGMKGAINELKGRE
ncbi:MAG: hypothetical protein ISS34_02145 [Candidatus Omnitrophica bacterium]|nr:hypothetical protein [Candidatus Omnitrophota bacterium]